MLPERLKSEVAFWVGMVAVGLMAGLVVRVMVAAGWTFTRRMLGQ